MTYWRPVTATVTTNTMQALPITTPSVERNARNLFDQSASNATRHVSLRSMHAPGKNSSAHHNKDATDKCAVRADTPAAPATSSPSVSAHRGGFYREGPEPEPPGTLGSPDRLFARFRTV